MRPPTKKQYIREQKTICGKNYAEVDFCWISEKEHRAGTRGRKRFASSLAQQGRNAERARRTLVQLLNTNFDEQGFSLTLTYEDIYLPGGDDAAWLDVQNYLQRIRRWLKKQKWPNAGKLKWVCVTENQEADPAHGLKEVRYHHHMVLQVDGLTPEQRAAMRDALENQWSTGTNRYREPLGTVNADRLQPEHDSLEGLAKYLLKSPRRKSGGMPAAAWSARPTPDQTIPTGRPGSWPMPAPCWWTMPDSGSAATQGIDFWGLCPAFAKNGQNGGYT